jgi:uncharacterized protein (DUF169 family)
LIDVVRQYLGMKDKVVGVKINPTRDYQHPREPVWFCQVVKDGTSRDIDYAIDLEDLACPNADITLGFRSPRYVQIEPRIKEEVKRIRVGPVDGSDLVLLCLNGEQVMTLSILLGGITTTTKGELGVCGEAVAATYNEAKPHLTFLCNGARLMGGFRPNELLLAIPLNEFNALAHRIEDLLKTGGSLCGCQVSDIPPDVVTAFKEAGFDKGADYFFGKIEGLGVRIYLNKDTTGRIRHITIYIPIRRTGDVAVNPPFQIKRRGTWTDVFGVFDIGALGIDLYTGRGMKRIFAKLVKNAFVG